ncbi:MAG: glutamate--tRNA ligase family protein [Gaiellaceae bacterium]
MTRVCSSPSPTGSLHVGNALSAAAYRRLGDWTLLRFDDTALARNVPEGEPLREAEGLDLALNEGPLRESASQGRYGEAGIPAAAGRGYLKSSTCSAAMCIQASPLLCEEVLRCAGGSRWPGAEGVPGPIPRARHSAANVSDAGSLPLGIGTQDAGDRYQQADQSKPVLHGKTPPLEFTNCLPMTLSDGKDESVALSPVKTENEDEDASARR